MYSLGYFITEYTFWFIVLLLLYVGLVGGLGAWLADKKGYSPGAWFFLCLLSGVIGFITLAGAPSQKVESLLDEINVKLDAASSKNSNNTTSTPSSLPSVKLSGNTWFCRQCKTENASTVDSCKVCGEYR